MFHNVIGGVFLPRQRAEKGLPNWGSDRAGHPLSSQFGRHSLSPADKPELDSTSAQWAERRSLPFWWGCYDVLQPSRDLVKTQVTSNYVGTCFQAVYAWRAWGIHRYYRVGT